MPRSSAQSDLVSDGIPNPPWHIVRRSPIHGSGVFAKRKIPAGTRILEYVGEVIDSDEADRRHPVNPEDPFHTFFFAVADGKVIDGGVRGNEGRYINHSCEPNCEAEETEDGRIFVVALQPIDRGEELNYDYGLILDARHTATLKKQYECRCGAPSCRGTMLAPKARARVAQAKHAPVGKKAAGKQQGGKAAEGVAEDRTEKGAESKTGKAKDAKATGGKAVKAAEGKAKKGAGKAVKALDAKTTKVADLSADAKPRSEKSRDAKRDAKGKDKSKKKSRG